MGGSKIVHRPSLNLHYNNRIYHIKQSEAGNILNFPVTGIVTLSVLMLSLTHARRRSVHRITELICVIVVVVFISDKTVTRNVTAFHLIMMSSSSRQDAFKKSLVKAASSFLPPPPPGTDAISSNLISQLAVYAIKRRLKEERTVNCDVNFSSSNLLWNGRVGPVTVSGKDWCSYRGLSCRAIEATVEQCELDAKMIISNRKLLLTTPALGKALVALTAKDFGSFITHPLMKTSTSAIDNIAGSSVDFHKDGTIIDPITAEVIFMCTFVGIRWRCSLQRSSETKKATVRVHALDDSDAASVVASTDDDGEQSSQQKLSGYLERFFNEMVFELDGTYLTYRDMMVTDKGGIPSVMIALNIKVRKLPSPGMDF